jgi:branched-chain amino acid aminotransferase
VVVDGVLHAAGTPVLPAEDRGFLLGMAVYETVLVQDGHVPFLAEHLARLERGAREMGMDWPPPAAPEESLAVLAAGVEASTHVARLTVSTGIEGGPPRVVVTARAVSSPPAEGVVVALSPYRAHDDALANVKATSRLRHVLARREAEGRGAWEALFVNGRGDLAEGTISNVFVLTDGVLRTPPIEDGCLGGIVRTALLEELLGEPLVTDGGTVPVAEEPIDFALLRRGSEVFLTNTTARVVPVRSVLLPGEELELPGPHGPVARAARERVALLEERDRARNPRRVGC